MIDTVLKWGQAIALVGAVLWGVHTLDVAARDSVRSVEATTAVLTEKISTLGIIVNDFKGWVARAIEDHERRLRDIELDRAAHYGRAENN